MSFMVFHKSINARLIMEDTFPDLEDYLQGFPQNKSASLKFLICVLWEILKTLTEKCWRMATRLLCVKWTCSTWQTDIVSDALKQKREENGLDENEVCTAMRRHLNSLQNKQSLWTVSQNISCVKKSLWSSVNAPNKIFWFIHVFSIIRASSSLH
jgi:hypothetical protein